MGGFRTPTQCSWRVSCRWHLKSFTISVIIRLRGYVHLPTRYHGRLDLNTACFIQTRYLSQYKRQMLRYFNLFGL